MPAGMPSTISISNDSRLRMKPRAVEANTAGASAGIVTRKSTPARLLRTSPASSIAASMALNAGVMSMKRIDVLNARWHQTMPQ
jgi:hypothetical protein